MHMYQYAAAKYACGPFSMKLSAIVSELLIVDWDVEGAGSARHAVLVAANRRRKSISLDSK